MGILPLCPERRRLVQRAGSGVLGNPPMLDRGRRGRGSRPYRKESLKHRCGRIGADSIPAGTRLRPDNREVHRMQAEPDPGCQRSASVPRHGLSTVVTAKGISQQLSANLAPVQPFSTILRVAENPAESGRNLPTRRLLACQPESVRRLGELRPLLIHRRLDESMIPGIMRRPLMP